MAKRDGMGKHPLKAWDDPAWQRPLSKTLTVSRVDEDIPTDAQTRDRKPWSIALTRERRPEHGDVQGLPAGRSLLLSEAEVMALVAYLFEPQTVLWSENPSPTETGEVGFLMFLQPGMVAISESGQLVNGEAHWTLEYFKRQEPLDGTPRTPKFHTLPWRLAKDEVQ